MRLRREPELDPETARELEALEAALAGAPVDPEHEELAALALAVREERPLPRPEFALDLDLRARDGFQAAESARPAPSAPRGAIFRRRWTLALGTAASVFIVVVAVVATQGGGDGNQNLATPASGDTAASGGRTSGAPEVQAAPPKPADRAGGGAATAAPATSPPLPSPVGAAPRARERKVERDASLTLAAPRERIEDVADDAIRVTERHGGFVLRSSVTAGQGPNAGATLDLRLPSTRLEPALGDLSELGHVRARTQDSRDITAEFTSPRRRLADALAERRGLLRQLARAATPNETAAVRARLRAVSRRINRAQTELRRLRERVSYSAVAVAIEPGTRSHSDGGWTLGDAAGDALGVLRVLLGAALVGLAVLVPAGLVAGAGWFAYRAVLRRRREQALEM